MVPEQHQKEIENLGNYSETHFAQISLVQSIGTNRKLNAITLNNLSLNVFSGYSFAIEGIEIGSLLNIVKSDVKGAQIAGLADVIGGNLGGTQIAGLLNNTQGNFTGLQLYELLNKTKG
jgi:hypothetical protein